MRYPSFLLGAIVSISAGFAALAAAPASAATESYTDPGGFCATFFALPNGQSYRGDVTIKCARLGCGVTPAAGQVNNPALPVQITVTCNPAATTFAWVIGPESSAGCPAPSSVNTATVSVGPNPDATPRTCYYEVVTTDSAPQPNYGFVRYQQVWP